jgi:carbon-monoxide dehydrogenase medium subunit
MIPRTFEYVAPKTVNEATSLLKKYGSSSKILAGGMSLIPVMKLRLASPTYLIDINGISSLEYIKETSAKLLIGALTRHHTIESSKVVQKKARLLAETAAWIGDPQVRNTGTIGGSLTHADPSGDWGAAILACRAEIRTKGPNTERIIKSDEFFIDTFASAVKPNELLTEVRVPLHAQGGGAYAKLERKAGDFATVGVAVQIGIDKNIVCAYVGIGLTALGPTNLRAKKGEAALLGKVLNERAIAEAAEAASEDAQPTSDPLRGSAEYKKEMAKVFTKRALMTAFSRAKGGN